MASRGIIYSATGDKYIAEAVASAVSSLRYNDMPHLIFADPMPETAPRHIDFVPFHPCGRPFLDKVRNLRRTPFDETLFIDTDTYVAANLDDVFDLLRRFDLAVTHAPGYTKCDDREQSEAFYEFNTGVIAYRVSPAMDAFLAEWDRLYTAWSANPPFHLFGNDQAPFRRVLWNSQLSFYVLTPEYNYRPTFPGKLVGRAKIIHGRSTNYERLEAHLNAASGPRTFPRFAPDHPW
jgi:hypothetical protein